ncbi:MAG: site-specific integrase [Planctomycetota bacterium]
MRAQNRHSKSLIRRREICNLRWEDINFDQQKTDILHKPYACTKTKRSRSVALRQETAELLGQLCVQRTNEFVFEKPVIFYNSLDKWFKKLVKSVGISYCTLHDLRKTCNTMMKNAGVSAEAAMQILGHLTFKVNQKYYTGVLTEQQKHAINSIPSVG